MDQNLILARIKDKYRDKKKNILRDEIKYMSG